MPWGIVAGAVIGGVASTISADKQAGAARDAANSTVAENQREFDTVRSDTADQRALGADADAQLRKLYGYGSNQFDANGVAIGAPSGTPDLSSFTQSPDYQFNLDQGTKALNNSVAQGRGLSGAALKAGTQYASGLASQQYGDYVNRLMAQAGLGQTGVNTSAAAGASVAGNDSNAFAIEGNARASAYGSGAAGINNSVQGGIGNYLLSQYLKPSSGTLDSGWGSGANSNSALLQAGFG